MHRRRVIMTLRLLESPSARNVDHAEGPFGTFGKTQGSRLLIGLNAGLARPQAPIPCR